MFKLIRRVRLGRLVRLNSEVNDSRCVRVLYLRTAVQYVYLRPAVRKTIDPPAGGAVSGAGEASLAVRSESASRLARERELALGKPPPRAQT